MSFFNQLFGKGRSDNSSEFHTLVEQSMEELRLKTEAHDGTWRLGEASWNVNQDAGTIVFTRLDGITATCPVQIIGTYDTQENTWLWGWNHPSVVPALQEHARKVRTYGEEHGVERLTTQELRCTENEAWEFTALACKLCEAQGAYRGPAGRTLVFMTFGEVKLSQSPTQTIASTSIKERVHSREAAVQAYQAGELEKLYLFPIEWGGVDTEVNVVYVPSQVAAEKQAFDAEVARLAQQEKINGYEARPEYDDESCIPSRIVVKASGEQSIQKIIDVDKYM